MHDCQQGEVTSPRFLLRAIVSHVGYLSWSEGDLGLFLLTAGYVRSERRNRVVWFLKNERENGLQFSTLCGQDRTCNGQIHQWHPAVLPRDDPGLFWWAGWRTSLECTLSDIPHPLFIVVGPGSWLQGPRACLPVRRFHFWNLRPGSRTSA